MTEWLFLAVLVPAIVVPVVLLVGFAGCDQVFGLDRLDELRPAPVIDSATGTSLGTITLAWMIDPTATRIEFERIEVDLVGPPYTFSVPASPAGHEDRAGLNPARTYQYTARAIFADGDMSLPSAPVSATTLGPPAFDAKGVGAPVSGTASASATWSHTASDDSSAVVVGLQWAHRGGFLPPSGTPTRTATFGGTPMTSLGAVGLNNVPLTSINGTFVFHELFGLLNPPTGPQTVSLSVGRPGAAEINVQACSLSYTAVSAFGSVSTDFGTEAGTSLSQDVIAAVNEVVVQMFTTDSGPITGYSQTLRVDGVADDFAFVTGDAPGAASVPFTATRVGGVDYAGLAVRLTPIS